MSLLQSFAKEQWDAVPLSIAGIHCLSYDIDTPRTKTHCVVWESPDGAGLFHTAAADSFEPAIAEVIVQSCQLFAADFPSTYVQVLETSFNDTQPFETVVVAPTSIALFDHLSEPMKSKIYLVAPAYRSEFHEKMDGRDFRHQIGRKDGWRVYVYRWNRPEKKAPSWD